MPAEDRPPLNEFCDGDPLARELARLKPAEPRFDPRLLMYEAGRASRSAAIGRWRRACLVATVALVGSWVGFLYFPDRMPEPLARTDPRETSNGEANLRMMGQAIQKSAKDSTPPSLPYQPSPEVPISYRPGEPNPERGDPAEYLRVRDAVIRVGVAALPASAPPVQPTVGSGSSWLLPPDVYAHPLLSVGSAPKAPKRSEETEE